MQEIKRYQVRGVPGEINRVSFDGRIVDYWAPKAGSDHLLIAHDGQNIFDPNTASYRKTWRMAQSAIRISQGLGKTPPLIIAVFHSSDKTDPHGRGKDLTPEKAFKSGIEPIMETKFSLDDLRGDKYLNQIFTQIVPTICEVSKTNATPDSTAVIGSSMGGLATLYAMTQFPERFQSALAFSIHWSIGGEPLVNWLLEHLPNATNNKIWMSRGTKGLDATYVELQNYADRKMNELGWYKPKHYESKVFNRTSHNERSWAKYLDEAMTFWLNKSI